MHSSYKFYLYLELDIWPPLISEFLWCTFSSSFCSSSYERPSLPRNAISHRRQNKYKLLKIYHHMARGAFDKHKNARKSNVLNLFRNQPFWVSQTFVIYFLSYGRFLIKRIYCKFLPNSDINGPVNRQFSQASRRKPFGPLFYSQTFGSLTAGPLVENHFLAIILLANFQVIDCCAW